MEEAKVILMIEGHIVAKQMCCDASILQSLGESIHGLY